MKLIFVVLSFFSISVLANTNSLQAHIDSQVVDTISPVTFNGFHFVAGKTNAAICGALGYTRFVSVEEEPCEVGQDLLV
ncbi:MAG: hypothetical protein AAF203_10405, partial [Pseudomonadota bacterium]